MATVLFSSCANLLALANTAPETFIRGEAGHSSVLIAEGITFDRAFDDVVSVLFRSFELEMINKEAGYIRTAWNTFHRSGSSYRTRVTLNMSPTRNRIDILTEAEWRNTASAQWIRGNDTHLLETIRRDIAGNVGM